ncbi:MAG: baseplate J/gp47 family protein [Fimbriimonas sp.]|nr:baseplate J/gp47 family protein [Fimbriimonas sp.]
MTAQQTYTCLNPHRIALVRDITDGSINAIDFLEVLANADPTKPPDTLEAHFVHPIVPVGDWSRMVLIEGGVRFPAPKVVSAVAAGLVLTVKVSGDTDASTYTLKLVKSRLSTDPPDHIDAILSKVSFSFRVLCPSDFDCQPDLNCEDGPPKTAYIDYLSKDYSSFRRLMLDRIGALLSDGFDTNAADPAVTIVEVLAYAADQLSYYQDAVSTEAYLGTARLRTSMSRHSRLLDYRIDDGQNARVWMSLEISGPVDLKAGTAFISKFDAGVILDQKTLDQAYLDGRFIFEAMHDATLLEGLNEIDFHTWGDRNCCIEAGSTTASLVNWANRLDLLASGQLLLLEQTCDPNTGVAADADVSLRHVVRLVEDPVHVTDPLIIDPLTRAPLNVVLVTWSLEDALPFSLPLSSPLGPAAKARGNIVLADHGYSVSEPAVTDVDSDGRLRLQYGPVTRQARYRTRNGSIIRDADNLPVLFDPTASAVSAIPLDPVDVWPQIKLPGDPPWFAVPDLLQSDGETQRFVVETENNGVERLRFGDGIFGKPAPTAPRADYRVGNGSNANLGPEAIGHIVGSQLAVRSVRNPMAAVGGRDPEPIESIRKNAPEAFKVPHRAVTIADYEQVCLLHPEVQRAKAERVWTGSWYATRLFVDRKHGLPIDDPFKVDLRAFLESYRLANVDLEIVSPVKAPLDIAMTVCVDPSYFRSNVKSRLFEVFSNKSGGFFDPDVWSFGQQIALSEVIETAMSVTGVHWVDLGPTSAPPNRFQRLWSPSTAGLTTGVIKCDSVEIFQLDNDPSFPENGKLEFYMEGGL